MELRYLEGVVTLRLDVEACVGCGRCTEVCPHAVFELVERKARLRDRDACIECGACQRNCPVGAVRVRAGVGCATGMLNTILGIRSDCCCSSEAEGGCACGDAAPVNVPAEGPPGPRTGRTREETGQS